MGKLAGSVWAPHRACGDESAKEAARAQACNTVYKILDLLVTEKVVMSLASGILPW